METRAIGLLLAVAGVVVMVSLEFIAVSDGASRIVTLLAGVVALLGAYLAYQSPGSDESSP